MDQIWQIITQYHYIGVAVLILIQMIMLVVTIRLIRKLTRYVESIHQKVQSYLQVIMDEDATEYEDAQSDEQHLVSGQEQQMVNAIAQKKKMQQEAVFDAVLQEIFP